MERLNRKGSWPVAQAASLPFRRLPTCRSVRMERTLALLRSLAPRSRARPTGSRRNGRLAACATLAWALLLMLWVCLAASATVQAEEPTAKDAVVVDAPTEAIIRGALKYLASKQLPNGSWGSSQEEQPYPIAMTGYVLMTFQAAGQLPGEGEFGKTVSMGLQFLLEATAADGVMGNRANGNYMYGHGVAAIALAEMYGQTKAPTMRPKLEKIVKLIVASQNPEGGWRYRPVPQDADISVTVLQVVALRAAKNGGLEVPQVTIDRAVRYVKSCFHPGSGGFTYQPGREPGFARTAAAIYSLQVCGLYEDMMVKRGSDYLLHNLKTPMEWFTYGNFYAAPAQYMIGGETWQKWYGQLKGILLKNVSTRGDFSYWETSLDKNPIGMVYGTAVYTMILAMPYHYVPLYQR